jgi:hypothetical protein
MERSRSARSALRAAGWALLIACPAAPAIWAASAIADGPATRAECEAAGGRWGRFGLRPQELCNLPTPDAGKPCTDARECASACVAPESAAPGSRAQGACYGRTLLQGTCLKQVRDGVVTAPLCAD